MIIILDRDGVINFDSKDFIKSPEEWIAIPGSLEAIAKLTNAGFQVVIASNQSGIGRQYFDVDMLNKIHEKLLKNVESHGGKIAGIFYCPHLPEDYCQCRKPKSGLFQQIAQKFSCDLENVIAIGDSYRDIQAGNAVGCRPILVLTGNGKKTLADHPELRDTIDVYDDLLEAVESILKKM